MSSLATYVVSALSALDYLVWDQWYIALRGKRAIESIFGE